jgi:ATP-dependent Lhr-like helicase
VLLGTDPQVKITQRAQRVLAEIREDRGTTAHPAGTVIGRSGVDVRWWTWAGFRTNATLAATLVGITDEKQHFDDCSIRLRTDLTRDVWTAATADAAQRLCLPDVDEQALNGLKFSEALPHRLAVATLAARLADLDGAARVLNEPAQYTITGR